MICPGWDDQRYGLVRTSSQTLAVTPQKLHAVRACPCLEEAKEKLIRAATNHLTDATMCYAMKMLKEKVAGQKKAKKIRWGGRLRGKTEAAMSKSDYKQRSLQLDKKRPSSVTSCRWSLLCLLSSHWLSMKLYLWSSGGVAEAHLSFDVIYNANIHVKHRVLFGVPKMINSAAKCQDYACW